MEINRQNYETYFLLWVDGELSNQQQNDVEQFIDNNPDLAIELALLQEAKLPIDHAITFSGKESLLKIESPALSLNTYEDYFLLYIDNELSKKEKQEVELFVLQHPALQAEFLLLQQTILTNETIVFANKELLYKKEEKEKPVIYFNWRTVAIAAALIGLIFSIWMIVPNNLLKLSNNQIAKTKNTIIPSTIKSVPLIAEELLAAKPINSKTNLNSLNKNESINNTQKIITSAPTENVNNSNEILATTKKSPIPDKSQLESVNATSITGVDNNTAPIIAANEKNKAITASLIDVPEQPSIFKQTVYRELDTDESSSSLYVGSLEINKDKLRGFFRKAGTIFRSKSRQIEDKTDTNK